MHYKFQLRNKIHNFHEKLSIHKVKVAIQHNNHFANKIIHACIHM